MVNPPRYRTGRSRAGKYRTNAWIGAAVEHVTRQLEAHRANLSACLAISAADVEARRIPAAYPNSVRDVGAYVGWRGAAPAGAIVVSRVDLAIEEVAAALVRWLQEIVNVTWAASPAAQRQLLKRMTVRPAAFVANWFAVDPATRQRIETHYPGGWLALEQNAVNAGLLQKAARAALAELPVAGRGRPRGTNDDASHRLVVELAEIYFRYRDERPTRRVFASNREAGPFRDLVAIAMSAVPDELRRTGKNAIKGIDHLVRLGVAGQRL